MSLKATKREHQWAAFALHSAATEVHDFLLPRDPYERRIAFRNFLTDWGNDLLNGNRCLEDPANGQNLDSSFEGDSNERSSNSGDISGDELVPSDDSGDSFDHLCIRLARTSVRHQ